MTEFEEKFINAIKYTNRIFLTKDGKTIELTKNRVELENVVELLIDDTFVGLQDMPALSVTADEFVDELKKQGMFLELEFEKVIDINGYKFDKIGFVVQTDYKGVDINRSLNGKYFGRNLYVNLFSDMVNLYNFLLTKI